MTEVISNVDLSTETFGNWLSKTNQVITALRTKVVSTSAPVTGNVQVNGTITSFTVTANVISANALTVANNVVWHAGNDGAGSGLDADLLDGQTSTYYTDIASRLGYTPLNAASYTAADVLSKLLTVDGTGSGIDADLLDGQSSAYYTSASNLSTGTIPAARLSGNYSVSNFTVSANIGAVNAAITGNLAGNTATFVTVSSTNLSGNGANVTSVNAFTLNSKSDTYFANSTHVHDLSVITGTAQLVKYDTAGSFTKPQRMPIVSLVDGATVTIDLNSSNMFKWTIGGNRTLANPTNIAGAEGQEVMVFITQDGTGSRTATFGSFWKFPNGVAPTLSTTAGAVDCIVGVVFSSTQIMCTGLLRDMK